MLAVSIANCNVFIFVNVISYQIKQLSRVANRHPAQIVNHQNAVFSSVIPSISRSKYGAERFSDSWK